MSEAAPARVRPKMFRPEEFSASVQRRVWHSPDTLEITFSLRDRPPFEYYPGQYLNLFLPDSEGKESRSYSIWTHPLEVEKGLTTIARIIPGGKASTWLEGLSVGSEVRFTAPIGVFFLRDPLPSRLYFVGTGTGVVPLRAMLRELFLRKDHEGPSTLYFGVRHQEDLFQLEEFQTLEREQPRFRFVPTLSRPDPSWKGARGRVTAHFTDSNLPVDDAQFYLCGNGAMIDEMTSLLLARGVDRPAIIREKYFA